MEHIRIRPVRSSDEGPLIAFYASLTAESRRARFLGCCQGLNPQMAHNLCSTTNIDEAGFVAERISGSRREIVGHSCLTDAGDGSLEIGIAVADEAQGHHLGHRLFAASVAWAEHNEIDRIVATAFSDNWRVLRLLRESGHATLIRDAGSGVSSVSIDLNDHLDALHAA